MDKYTKLIEVLRDQQQCDEDGHYCIVSRQAVDEAIALLTAQPSDSLDALKSAIEIAGEIHEHWDADNDSKVGKMLLALAGHLPKYDKRIDVIHAALNPRGEGVGDVK